MYDSIIIGAGPAGLTAAIYLKRANLNVLVLEGKSYGGQIINAANIENYPAIENISGFNFATNLYNQVKNLGTSVYFENVVKIDKDLNVYTKDNVYKGKSLVIATGASNKKLGLVNEDKLIGKGLSYCATCDGNFYKDKVVAVVGGGNTALEDALYLSNIAKKVYLIHRREAFRADQYIEELKEKDNVEFILNANVTSLNGDILESIDINVAGNIKNIKIDGLFVAIGQKPNSDIFSNVLEIDSNGYIISNNGKTNVSGIYAAGDVRVKDLRQLVTACSDGAVVASKIINSLSKE